MRAIPILILTLLLLACSQAGPGGGATGGAVGGDGSATLGGPLGGGGAAGAQPLDSGFAGANKDYEGLEYTLHDGKGRVICKESSGDVKVRLSGVVKNDETGMGIAGFLAISDLTAQRRLITRTALDGTVGRFSTTMSLRSPYQLLFGILLSSEEPLLETLEPFGGSFLMVVQTKPKPDLVIEANDGAMPCVEAVQEPEWGAVNENEPQLN